MTSLTLGSLGSLGSLAVVALLGGTACQKTPEEPAASASTRSAPTVMAIPGPAPNPPAVSVSPPRAGAGGCPSDPELPPPLPTAQLSFEGGPTVTVEIARGAHDTERGLMYRTKMPEDRGMLFYLTAREDHAFWMRNTCIPLDMLFVDGDGTVVGILEDVPILNDEARSVGKISTHVLEMNGGWCRRHGVKAGQKLLFPRASK